MKKSALDRKLGAIRVARKQLGMDEETYRLMLREVTGKASSKELSLAEVDRVLDHLIKRGFKLAPPKGRTGGQSTRRMDTSAEAQKVRALWLFLHELGEVKNPSEQALASYVRRIARVDDMHWASSAAMSTLIETLKKWAVRVLPEKCKAAYLDLLARGLATAEVDGLCVRATGKTVFDPWNDAWEAIKKAQGAGT